MSINFLGKDFCCVSLEKRFAIDTISVVEFLVKPKFVLNFFEKSYFKQNLLLFPKNNKFLREKYLNYKQISQALIFLLSKLLPLLKTQNFSIRFCCIPTITTTSETEYEIFSWV